MTDNLPTLLYTVIEGYFLDQPSLRLCLTTQGWCSVQRSGGGVVQLDGMTSFLLLSTPVRSAVLPVVKL